MPSLSASTSLSSVSSEYGKRSVWTKFKELVAKIGDVVASIFKAIGKAFSNFWNWIAERTVQKNEASSEPYYEPYTAGEYTQQ